MSSSGYLVPPGEDASQEKLWVETWKRLDRFLPDLRKELDLEKTVEVEKKDEKAAAPVEPVS
jgi:brefeldin A-resistance guanine nucleotide exchange factor 1